MAPNFDTRIIAAVTKRLGIPVSIVRWDTLKTGAEVPVIRVPADKAEHAHALGLTIEIS